jgi:membrane protease YdiL (CAAX protease family)
MDLIAGLSAGLDISCLNLQRSCEMDTMNHPSPLWRRRLTAILEVCGVYMLGLLLAFLAIRLLGIDLQNPLEVLKANPNADLFEMSKDLGWLLLFQYGGILLPAFLIGWWHRRRRASGYGLTTAGQPVRSLILTGVLTFAVASLPTKLLTMFDRLIPLGPKAVTQEIVYSLDWTALGFWVFMAAGSFLLVPILEELFYRSYVQNRLAEEFEAPSAILITALFFTFSHSQYYLLFSVWNTGMLLTTLVSALAWGYVFHRTRSLLPCMIAHALLNFPVRGLADFLVPVLMVGLAVFYRREVMQHANGLVEMFKSGIVSKRGLVVAVIFMTLSAVIVAVAQDVAVLVGLLFVIVTLVLEALEKRQLRRMVLSTTD